MTGVGACTVKYDQAGNVNYNAAPQVTESVNVLNASQAITVTIHAPANAAYGTMFTVAATGGGSGNPVTFSSAGSCTNSGAAFTITSGSGTCSVKYAQAGGGNYDAAPQVTESVNAQKADQTISVTAHAPAGAVYDTTFVVAGNAAGGSVTLSSAGACSNTGSLFRMTSGTGTCSVRYDQAGNGNYNAAPQVTESVNAVRADQSISFAAPADRMYGTPDFDPGASASTGFAVSYSASGSCSIVAAVVHVTGAGSCGITASQAGDANYNAAPAVLRTFSIAKAPLTITASDRSKLYRQSLSPGTTAFVASGLVGTDGVAGVTLTSAGMPAAAAVGTYPIVPSAAVAAAGTDLGSYAVAYANGTLTVRQANVVGLRSASVGSGAIDSFDSSLGRYGPSNHGSAAGLASNGPVTLGGVTVHGDVSSTKGSVKMSSTVVTGDVTAGTTVQGGTVQGGVTASSPSSALTAARVAACRPYTPARRLRGRFTYSARTGDLTVVRARTVTLPSGTYCFHDVTLSGQAVLRVNGPVTLRLTGRLNARGGRLNNTTGRPASLRIESSFTGRVGVSLFGGSNAYLRLYAPQTDVAIFGSAPLFGSFLGETLTLSGKTSLHADEH